MFTQEANGNFSIDVTGEFHCGPGHTSPKIFGWAIKIEWLDEALDGNGFLLDNMSFKKYFNALAVTSDSCELLTLKAAKHFRALANERDKGGVVTVTIEVPGLARITNTQP